MLAKSLQAAAGNAAEANYIEDVFSTWLYTGNGSTQTITNGIDLAGEGGLVWIKNRSVAVAHGLFDTTRGTSNFLSTNNTSVNYVNAGYGVTAFNSNGFAVTDVTDGTAGVNGVPGTEYGGNYVSWTFREQPKFFDVVTYTGTGANRTVAHNLGSVPGCIIVKRTDTTGAWQVYHRANTANPETDYLVLNTDAATADSDTRWNDTQPTDAVFSLGTDATVNASGGTYVAYIFAHDSGGFGLTGTDNVISCGSYTGTGALQTITLGYEPQWLLIKNATTGSTNWSLIDCIRSARLRPNVSDTEDNTGFAFVYDNGDGQLRGAPTANGFQVSGTGSEYSANGDTFIYIAIRRPMKTPTTGTSVFTPVAYTGTNVDNRLVNTGIVTDMVLARIRTATSDGGFYNASRMVRGGNFFLETATTAAVDGDADSFMTPTSGAGTSFSAMNGFGVGNDATRKLNQSSTSQLAYAFQRAPGFFDEVCSNATSTGQTLLTHNLGVAPEMIIKKLRNGTANWNTWASGIPFGDIFDGPSTDGAAYTNGSLGNTTQPSATQFQTYQINTYSYVYYLFASAPGVSKVFNFTGNGSSQTINCGFTGGARFVMIKRTDSTGNWLVVDTARGLVSAGDPTLYLNSTAAEVTGVDWIDPDNSGFIVNQEGTMNANVSSATYIGLAIA